MEFCGFCFGCLFQLVLLSLLLLVNDFSAHQRSVNSSATPIEDQSFADAEQHDGDLGDGEETPNGSLFHQIRGDETGEVGAKSEEEGSLKNHSFLFVQGEEGGEHQKRMNRNSGNDIGRIGHGDRPSKMVISFECADLVSSQPFS